MTKFKETYVEISQNAEILAGAVERFVIPEGRRIEYGSGNSLILTSVTDNAVKVSLDETKVFGILQGFGSLIIKPEDGISFDGIKLENLGADAIALNEIFVRMARADEVL